MAFLSEGVNAIVKRRAIPPGMLSFQPRNVVLEPRRKELPKSRGCFPRVGNVFGWYPGWLNQGLRAEEGPRPAN